MIWLPGNDPCRKRSWSTFQKHLSELLEACAAEDGRSLTINCRDRVRYVRIQSAAEGDLSAEAVSNDYLSGEDRLGQATIRRLSTLGWKKHGQDARRNFSRRWTAPVDFGEVSRLVAETFGAYGIPSPLSLEIILSAAGTRTLGTKTMVPEFRTLQLPSGTTVQNALSGRVYRIGMPLGAGGFGAVYRVSQIAGPRLPTASVIKVTLEPTAWHREAYFGDLLKRESAVVRMYESFAWLPSAGSPPVYCLISELMDGGDMHHYFQKNTEPWKESKARYEVIRVLRAVRLLHQGGAVHRDLTPRNVFVTSEGSLKIGDFGIALHGVAQNGVAADAFNPGYAPPAFLAGSAKHWSPADDVFHIGKLFAMLLSGGALPAPSRRQVKAMACGAEAKAIIQRCIGEKRKRFRDADELLCALEEKLETPRSVRISSLENKHVVFTGGMAIKRAQARELVEGCGGICQDRVNQMTDIVVVGGQAAPNWIAEQKGNKLLDVDREWGRGHRIAVVGEARFLKLVKYR